MITNMNGPIDPVCFTLLGWPIHWYGIMVALGFLATVAHWNRVARKEGRRTGFGTDFGLLIMVSGILGARIAYVIANWQEYAAAPIEIFRIDRGGLVFYGGFIGATLAALILARVLREPALSLLDFGITGVPVGHALGRVGCFLNGCCYGSPTDAPWGVFTAGVTRHPVQLFEAAFNLALFGLLAWFYPRRKRNGSVLALYLMCYSAWRFVAEFIRGDDRLHALGLTVAQELSIVLFLAGVGLWFAAPAKTTSAHA